MNEIVLFLNEKEKIVELELVCSYFPSCMLKVSGLLLPPLFHPSFTLSALLIRGARSEKKYMGDLIHRLSIRVIEWRAPKNQWLASAAADRKVVRTPGEDFSCSFVVRLLSDPLRLHGSRATGSSALLLNFCSISRDCTMFHPLSRRISGCSPSVSSTLYC